MLQLITVEPTLTLYMMAFMVTSIVEQAFFVHKACTVNHNFNSTVCDKIEALENEEYNKKVQLTVSEFHQWNDIAGHVFPIIIAFFMGSWSDRRGRKIPLILGLIGKLYYSSMVLFISAQRTWPLEYVVYMATLPSALTGADVAIFAAAFSYLADVTTEKSRTFRVTMLEVCYLATMPTGIALGSYLFTKVTNRSYAFMFSINVTLLILSIIYTCCKLQWRTSNQQRSLKEADSVLKDFFDLGNVRDTFKTLFEKRSSNKRIFLLLTIVSMGFYTFQRDEKSMSYLYLQLVLNWSFTQISTFRTFQSALQALLLLTVLPLLNRWLGWKDTVIIMIGALAHSVARIFYANGVDSRIIYIGGIFASLGPIVAPVIRSMVSKLVTVAERGKAFSLLSITDNAVPIISGTAYNQVYRATIHRFPSGIFYLTIFTQLVVLFIFVFIHFSTQEESPLHDAIIREKSADSENRSEENN